MQDQAITTTALVYDDGVIDICEIEGVIATLHPQQGEGVLETLWRAGLDGWYTRRHATTPAGYADVWEVVTR